MEQLIDAISECYEDKDVLLHLEEEMINVVCIDGEEL